MSPEQLRKQLRDYGVSTGPITPTTFPVYVRKLNNLRNRNGRLNLESRRTSAGLSSSNTVSAAANLNDFSSDESDTGNEGRRNRLSMPANHGVPSHYGRTRINNWAVTRSYNTVADTALPEERSSSTYEQLSLIRPSIRTYNYDDANRYSVPKSGIDTSSITQQRWDQQSLFPVNGNSGAAGAGKAAASGFDESRHSWQLISRFIVLLVLFFVIVVVLSYCFILRSSQLPIDAHSDYMLCSDDTPTLPKCTSVSELGIIQKMVRELLDALSTRAGDYDCGYQSDARSMCRSEVIQFLDGTVLVTAEKKAAEYITLIADLCVKNSHWGVEVYGNSNEKDFVLESVLGRKSLWCRITDSARYIFTIIFLMFLFLGAGCSLFVCIRLRRSAAEAECREVFDLVEKIIDMLQQNAAAAEAADMDPHERPVPPYLAIPHVRDALIPLHLRQAKQRIWDQAVKFLSAHESRVRVEHQQISGEG